MSWPLISSQSTEISYICFRSALDIHLDNCCNNWTKVDFQRQLQISYNSSKEIFTLISSSLHLSESFRGADHYRQSESVLFIAAAEFCQVPIELLAQSNYHFITRRNLSRIADPGCFYFGQLHLSGTQLSSLNHENYLPLFSLESNLFIYLISTPCRYFCPAVYRRRSSIKKSLKAEMLILEVVRISGFEGKLLASKNFPRTAKTRVL